MIPAAGRLIPDAIALIINAIPDLNLRSGFLHIGFGDGVVVVSYWGGVGETGSARAHRETGLQKGL